MSSRLTRLLALLSSVLIASIAPAAQPPTTQAAGQASGQSAAKLDLATQRVVLFKDGHGLVVNSGAAVADRDGRVFITDVPDAAVLGCFWASGENDKILGMRAEWDERKEIRDRQTACVTMAELLRANIGKSVTLEMIDKGDKNAPVVQAGQIVELLDLPSDAQPVAHAPGVPAAGAVPATPPVYTALIRDGVVTPGQFTAESMPGEGTLVRELWPRGGDFVVLAQENDRRVVLPVSYVKSIIGGKDVVTTLTRQQELLSRTKRLSFDFGKDAAGKPVALRLFYFTPGLRWIPTYRVGGELKDSAEVALQGEIINDVTDIEHAALDLVVGVPNFRFADTVSPLTLEREIRAAMVAANLSNACNQLLNSQFALDNRARVRDAAREPGAVEAIALAPELSGSSGEQDLFVYTLKDFSLKKGARATAPLWQQPAELRHLYTYQITARRNRASGSIVDDTRGAAPDGQSPTADQRSPMRIVLNQVWHQLELSNGGNMPWTTGAALMMRGMLPLGQDVLLYTPPGGKALLPVTVAVDIRGSVDEQETQRQPNAMDFDDEQYMLVTKKGSVTVNSFRKDKSDMRVTLSTGGKVLSASDGGTIRLNDFRAGDWDDAGKMRVNNHSDVTWEFALEPGTSKTLTYEVSFYVR